MLSENITEKIYLNKFKNWKILKKTKEKNIMVTAKYPLLITLKRPYIFL